MYNFYFTVENLIQKFNILHINYIVEMINN